jgi:hypothetical protein
MESKSRRKTRIFAKIMPEMTAGWGREESGELFSGSSVPLIVESSASFNPKFEKGR